jgi:hypothetical protein
MTKYPNTALSLTGHFHGPLMLMEVFRRMNAGIFGPNKVPRCLSDAAWIDAGYVIDAPETMPAGGCVNLTFPPDYGFDPGAEQLTVQREAA